ncbi:hypothetical protein LshimejAT787_1601360 [Lyophyllum shimeji]|uniref:Uncharacterized protein n=1 Tax=Lyophyllum shimeji TaxID=47721 RepID=A0A9P3PZY7_LYOSH|nr:hypothetical protein LshimejAT787_1601360 [Lyophyllum shimeji]
MKVCEFLLAFFPRFDRGHVWLGRVQCVATLTSTLALVTTLAVAYQSFARVQPRCIASSTIRCPKEAEEDLFPAFCGQPYAYTGTEYGHLYVSNRFGASADCGFVDACVNGQDFFRSQERLIDWG